MKKITFEDFARIMAYDVVENKNCLEFAFCVEGFTEYEFSWLGKMADKSNEKASYWYGLTEDGSQAYDYDSFEGFVDAKIFHNKSIKEIWELISFYDGFL